MLKPRALIFSRMSSQREGTGILLFRLSVWRFQRRDERVSRTSMDVSIMEELSIGS